MRYLLPVLAVALGWAAAAGAADTPLIHVDACRVYAEANPKTAVDCTAAAAKLCDGQPACEVPIGRNLAAQAREDAKVDLAYSCGKAHGEAGPNDLDDHAAVTLACALTN
ncbi:MAG TPA: hypothetical protein VKS60_10295 [Stellaceae bacterium]|nr:hypothetical protein [Stellaceae bacterium]